jgi:hypothetical protein
MEIKINKTIKPVGYYDEIIVYEIRLNDKLVSTCLSKRKTLKAIKKLLKEQK